MQTIPSPIKSLLTAAALTMLTTAAYSDGKMDIRVDRGVSEYEINDYGSAMEHWASALIRGLKQGDNVMYPASYLCSMWYHGKGVEKNLVRAEEACAMVQGKKGKFELDIFQGVLQSNSEENSGFEFKSAMADASSALRWYIDTYL